MISWETVWHVIVNGENTKFIIYRHSFQVGFREISVLSDQFSCESKTALNFKKGKRKRKQAKNQPNKKKTQEQTNYKLDEQQTR